MAGYIARRFLQLVPVLLGITLLVFFIFHYTADPTQIILGMHGSEKQRQALRKELGLDDPVLVQYGRYVGGVAQGDLGTSWMRKSPVAREIADKFPHTVELTIAAMLITVVVGILVGVISAIKPYSILDYFTMTTALLAVSIPVFVLGLFFISLFAVKLGWLPINGRMSATLLDQFKPPTGYYLTYALFTGKWAYFKDLAAHMFMPAVVLASATTALLARMTRATMLEVVQQDYIRTARAKGLSQRVVIYKHALKNAMIPIVTVIGLQFGSLLGGALLTESIFTWPGLGTLTISAVEAQDLPLVQGVVILVATLFVAANLAVDLLYAYIDPRIKYS
ncbi:MAG TPA: ABC transporter permease [Symbiobacteriaceae bacterium]|jgi:peptide/nickel transport system permease protein|nr:ABC transporter permease [Symbiobacteriaceae bacterium]